MGFESLSPAPEGLRRIQGSCDLRCAQERLQHSLAGCCAGSSSGFLVSQLLCSTSIVFLRLVGEVLAPSQGRQVLLFEHCLCPSPQLYAQREGSRCR